MRQIISMHNNSGFTLVELMVAMFIMLVSLLGLLHAINIAMEYNLKNQMRSEVVRVAEDVMTGMRTHAFDTVSATTIVVPSRLRNINRTYNVRRTITDITNPTSTVVSRQYQVDVKWLYKNVSTTHSIVSVRSRAE